MGVPSIDEKQYSLKAAVLELNLKKVRADGRATKDRLLHVHRIIISKT